MSKPNPLIGEEAEDGLSVSPPDPAKDGEAPAAGTSREDRIDIGSEDSMDASDPPSTSAPGSDRETEQAAEIERQQDA